MELSELLETFLANKTSDMHICMPAKIVTYDFKTQKATVQPALNQKYNDGEVVKLPIIHSVPVIHPSSGGASITFPVLKNDNVLLVFCERSLEEWLNKGEQITPDDPRQNHLTDAIAILGFRSFNQNSAAENNTDLLMAYSGSKVRLKPDGALEIESKTAAITVPTVNFNSTDVIVSGKLTAQNLEAKAEMKSATAAIGGKDFATHTHNGVKSGVEISGAVT